MRRILVRFVPMLALFAGLVLAGGAHASAAQTTTALAAGNQPAFTIWCC